MARATLFSLVVISLALLSSSVLAQQSLCDKYATLLHVNGAYLVGNVVNFTVGSVVANTVTARYFDGSLSPYQTTGAINYTSPTNAGALAHLVNNLNTFFFAALGCTDGSLGNYTGRNMVQAHAGLPIGPVQFESFNRQLLGVLAQGGVSAEDQLAILGVLNSLKSQICNQPACNAGNPPPVTFCDRYSTALNTTEYDLMDAVVAGVIANVTSASSPLKKYFDGTIPGTTNFLLPANAAALAALRGHLDQFFGQHTILNCTAANFPAYTGRTLPASHANLQIDVPSFNLFNVVVLDVMAKAGVTTADLVPVRALLQSTQSAIVTVTNTTTTGATTGGRVTTTTTGGRVATTDGSTSTSAATTTTIMTTTAMFVLFVILGVAYVL